MIVSEPVITTHDVRAAHFRRDREDEDAVTARPSRRVIYVQLSLR